jgi:hypothetical protein
MAGLLGSSWYGELEMGTAWAAVVMITVSYHGLCFDSVVQLFSDLQVKAEGNPRVWRFEDGSS